MNKNINLVMKELVKHFDFKEKTTLNRMRKKPDAFKILISCLLSLRARDEATESVSEKLYAVADTPEKIAKLPMAKLEKLIFSSGHYRKKARVLKSVSKDLIKRFDSKVPDVKEDLMSIRGVGPKTANIVLAFAFGQEVLPIDIHYHRIPNRLGWIDTKTPEETEKELEKILPRKYWASFNGVFVLFGREVCQPVSPWCSKCPVRKQCRRVGISRSR
jgi:endonuclease-3